MRDADDGAAMRLREVHHSLQAASHIVRPVHVDRNGRQDRINDQQRRTTDALHGVVQLRNVLRWIERNTLAVLNEALDERAARQVGAGRDQARHQGVVRYVFRLPDQHVALVHAGSAVWPAAAGGDYGAQAEGGRRLPGASAASEDRQLPCLQPAWPQPIDGKVLYVGAAADFDDAISAPPARAQLTRAPFCQFCSA